MYMICPSSQSVNHVASQAAVTSPCNHYQPVAHVNVSYHCHIVTFIVITPSPPLISWWSCPIGILPVLVLFLNVASAILPNLNFMCTSLPSVSTLCPCWLKVFGYPFFIAHRGKWCILKVTTCTSPRSYTVSYSVILSMIILSLNTYPRFLMVLFLDPILVHTPPSRDPYDQSHTSPHFIITITARLKWSTTSRHWMKSGQKNGSYQGSGE